MMNIYRMGQGSPPRVRGAVLPDCHTSPLHRITPACAGSRNIAEGAGIGATDHPRVCGEQTDRMGAEIRTMGSPPRVRGAATVFQTTSITPGITPACAGSR